MAKKSQNNYIETPRKNKRFRDFKTVDDLISGLRKEQKDREKRIKKLRGE